MSKVGRPEEFQEKYIDSIYTYLKKCTDKKVLFHKVRGVKSDSYEEKYKVNIPTIEGFADFIKVSRKSIYNWIKENEDFAYGIEKILNEQKIRLINMGLSGDYNPIIAKLVLSSNHGMKERVDNTSDDKPLNTFTDAQADRIAERITARKGKSSDTPSKEKSH